MKDHSAVPIEALREAVAIVGRTGSGKTYAAKSLVEPLLVAGERVCVLDPTGAWWGLLYDQSGKARRFDIPLFSAEARDDAITVSEAHPAILAQYIGDGGSAIIDLSGMSLAGMKRFATTFLEALYQSNRGNPLTLIFDEADLFAPQRPQPDQTTLLNRTEQIVRRGRIRGFRPWLITQRPAVLNKDVLSQAGTLVALKLTAPQDRRAIGDWIEGQADRDEGRKVLDSLPRMERGEGWVWCPGHNILAKTKFRPITTFDSSASPDGIEARVTRANTASLDAVRAQLEQAGAHLAEHDPNALRARVAELERKLAERPKGITSHELAQKYREHFLAGRDSMLAHALDCLAQTSAAMRRQHDSELRADDRPHGTASAMETLSQAVSVLPVQDGRVDSKNGALVSAVPGWFETGEEAGVLGKAERMILSVLGAYGERSKPALAILAGYAAGGGGFNNALSSLTVKKLIERTDSSSYVITDAGKRRLGRSLESLPKPGRALREHWCARLGKAERMILTSLGQTGRNSKAFLAKGAGYEASGGGFNNALSRLRTLGLINRMGEFIELAKELQ